MLQSYICISNALNLFHDICRLKIGLRLWKIQGNYVPSRNRLFKVHHIIGNNNITPCQHSFLNKLIAAKTTDALYVLHTFLSLSSPSFEGFLKRRNLYVFLNMLSTGQRWMNLAFVNIPLNILFLSGWHTIGLVRFSSERTVQIVASYEMMCLGRSKGESVISASLRL